MQLRIHSGHSKDLRAVALSPDGRYLLSASYDGTVKQWDATTGQVIRTHTGRNDSAVELPDQVEVSYDGKTGIVQDGLRQYAFDMATGYRQQGNYELRPKDVSPDGLLRVRERSTRLIVEEVASRRNINTLETSTTGLRTMNTMMFSPDGRYIAWAESNFTGLSIAKVWEVSTWTQVATAPASAANFSRDSRTLVLGSPKGGAPYLRDLASGEETFMENGPSGVTDMALSVDGQSVVAGMASGSAILWDLTTGKLVRAFNCLEAQPVLSVAVGTSDSLAATGCADASVWLWELRTGKQVKALTPALSRRVPALWTRYSLNGRRLVVGTEQQLTVWDTGENKESRRITLPGKDLPTELTVLPDVSPILGNKGIPEEAKSSYISDVKEDRDQNVTRWMELSKIVHAMAVHPNGQLVAVSVDRGIILWDINAGQVVRKYSDKIAQHLAMSPDGKMLLSETDAWDVDTGNVMSGPIAMTNGRNGVIAISTDNHFVACGEKTFVIKVWDLTSKKTQELRGHAGEITSLAFSPNHRTLVSGSYDGTVRLWDLQRGKEIAALISLGNGESLTITPDHFYRASRIPVKGVSFQAGDKLLPLEQFAKKLHKPEVVEERLSEAAKMPGGR
jgi:WD40 repeat protein